MFRSNILIDVTRGNDEEEMSSIDLGKRRPQGQQYFLQEDTHFFQVSLSYFYEN